MALSKTTPMALIADVLGLLRDLLRAGGLSSRAITPATPAPPVAAPSVSRTAVPMATAPSRAGVALPSGTAIKLPAGDPVLGGGACVQGFFSKVSWTGAVAMAPLPGTSQARVGLDGAAGVAAAPVVAWSATMLEGNSVSAFFKPIDWSGKVIPVAVAAPGLNGEASYFAPVGEADLFAFPVHQFFSRVGWKGVPSTIGSSNGHAPVAVAEPPSGAAPSKRRETGSAKEMFGEFKF